MAGRPAVSWTQGPTGRGRPRLTQENGYRNMASLGLEIFDSKKFFKCLETASLRMLIDRYFLFVTAATDAARKCPHMSQCCACSNSITGYHVCSNGFCFFCKAEWESTLKSHVSIINCKVNLLFASDISTKENVQYRLHKTLRRRIIQILKGLFINQWLANEVMTIPTSSG